MKLFHKKGLPLISVSVAIILAIGLLLFISAYSKKEAFSSISIWGTKETVIESQNIDTDNDGLKDWEEDLYQTDPLNSDTDGDGYLDGEEIDSGHNPLVKGPNDKQVFFPLPLGDKYNITNKVFTDFESVLSAYIEQKDEYVRNHPEITDAESYLAQTSSATLEELFRRAILYNEENWLQQAEMVLEELPEIFNIEVTDNDIRIVEQENQESIKTYLQTIAQFINSEVLLFQEKNFILLKSSLENNDFDNLDSLITRNNAQLKKLQEISVPAPLKDVHKKLLKTNIIIRNIFISLRGFEDDPIKATVAINETKKILEEWESLIESINNFANLNGIDLNL